MGSRERARTKCITAYSRRNKDPILLSWKRQPELLRVRRRQPISSISRSAGTIVISTRGVDTARRDRTLVEERIRVAGLARAGV